MSRANGTRPYRRGPEDPGTTCFRLEKTNFGWAWTYLYYDLEIGQSVGFCESPDQLLTMLQWMRSCIDAPIRIDEKNLPAGSVVEYTPTK